MIVYEYPFNERIRTLLRLEDLYEKFTFFLHQEQALQHHVALATIFEMLENPGKEIFKYFGSRKKIFNVHFRNVRGKRDDFIEVYPDEGDVDMVKAMLAYRDVDYPYMIMPDHVPYHPDDPGGSQTFAFAYGYIRALIQAVDQLDNAKS